jgi:predicted dehydrogenase
MLSRPGLGYPGDSQEEGVRFGLIGCGWAGEMRADAIAALSGFRLVAVSDQDTARANHLAGGHRAAVESDWRVLVGRADLDAVIVSTPPPLHVQMCVSAFEQGKHVLCEKPLARNPAEGRQIVEAAERRQKLLGTGFNLRFFPPIAKAREILDSGQIGELDHIRSYAGHPGGQEFTQAWVHDANVMGGGTLLDNGIHIIDLTAYFLGDVSEATGFATNHVWQFPGCEDNGFALLRNAAGRVATLHSSWSEWRGYQFRIEIYGTRGCVVASYPPMLTRVARRDAPDGPVRKETFLFPKLQVLERLRSYRWSILQSFTLELEAFARAARGEKSSAAVGAEGLLAVQVAYAVYCSSREGRAIRLNEL